MQKAVQHVEEGVHRQEDGPRRVIEAVAFTYPFNFHQSGSKSRTRRSITPSLCCAVVGTRKAFDPRCSGPTQSDVQPSLLAPSIRGKDRPPGSHARIADISARALYPWFPSPILSRQYSGLYRCRRHASLARPRPRGLVPPPFAGHRCSEAGS